jgi:predicted nucleic acid-binding protein
MMKTVAIAETIYADPSALFKLYVNEPQSRAVAAWRGSLSDPLIMTQHGRLELINAMGLAVYRGHITQAIYDSALAALEDDFERGRYVQADLLWRATLKRANELSRQFTRFLGCHSLDVLHVASALELGMGCFFTFDLRQRQLAVAVKLKLFDLAVR